MLKTAAPLSNNITCYIIPFHIITDWENHFEKHFAAFAWKIRFLFSTNSSKTQAQCVLNLRFVV